MNCEMLRFTSVISSFDVNEINLKLQNSLCNFLLLPLINIISEYFEKDLIKIKNIYNTCDKIYVDYNHGYITIYNNIIYKLINRDNKKYLQTFNILMNNVLLENTMLHTDNNFIRNDKIIGGNVINEIELKGYDIPFDTYLQMIIIAERNEILICEYQSNNIYIYSMLDGHCKRIITYEFFKNMHKSSFKCKKYMKYNNNEIYVTLWGQNILFVFDLINCQLLHKFDCLDDVGNKCIMFGMDIYNDYVFCDSDDNGIISIFNVNNGIFVKKIILDPIPYDFPLGQSPLYKMRIDQIKIYAGKIYLSVLHKNKSNTRAHNVFIYDIQGKFIDEWIFNELHSMHTDSLHIINIQNNNALICNNSKIQFIQ